MVTTAIQKAGCVPLDTPRQDILSSHEPDGALTAVVNSNASTTCPSLFQLLGLDAHCAVPQDLVLSFDMDKGKNSMPDASKLTATANYGT